MQDRDVDGADKLEYGYLCILLKLFVFAYISNTGVR